MNTQFKAAQGGKLPCFRPLGGGYPLSRHSFYGERRRYREKQRGLLRKGSAGRCPHTFSWMRKRSGSRCAKRMLRGTAAREGCISIRTAATRTASASSFAAGNRAKSIILRETVKNARNFVRFLMKKYDIPLANVVRHYDVTHKNCPAPFVEDAAAWQSFKAGLIQLTKEENMTEKQVKQLIAQAKTVYDTAESVPEWGRGTVDQLLSGDLLRGTDGKARPQRGNAARACCARSSGCVRPLITAY